MALLWYLGYMYTSPPGKGGAQARGEPGEITFVVDETNRDLDVKLRIGVRDAGPPTGGVRPEERALPHLPR